MAHSSHRRTAVENSLCSGIDLNLLVVFDSLRKERSVTRAAERIGLTQSGMSRALARLRDHFEDLLFLPHTGRLEMTPLAESLGSCVSEALDVLNRGLSRRDVFEPALADRRFRIATADYCEVVLLAPAIQKLATDAPRIRIEAVPTLPTDADALLRGDLDMVIAMRPRARSGIRATRLLTDGFAVVVRPGHPVLSRGAMGLEEYLGLQHVVVAPHGQSSSFIDTALARQGSGERDIPVRLQSFMAAAAMVAQSDMITTLPTQIAFWLARHYPLATAPLPFETPKFDLTLSWNDRFDNDAGHRWIRAVLTSLAKNLQCQSSDGS